MPCRSRPSLFKQILMASGCERYFQIVRLRDEDPRADRQAEFTQIDVEEFRIRRRCDNAQRAADCGDFATILDVDVPLPIPRMKYEQAMAEYGIDRPDLRFEMKLKDISDIAAASAFKVFSEAYKGGVSQGALRLAAAGIPEAILSKRP